MAKKEKNVKVTVTVSGETANQIDKLVGPKYRASLMKSLIQRYLIGRGEGQNVLRDAYNAVLKESKPMRERGKAHMNEGSITQAKRCFLLAAARELEALSFVIEPDELIIRSAVIEVLTLLKDGTGYRRLPEVPGGTQTSHAVV